MSTHSKTVSVPPPSRCPRLSKVGLLLIAIGVVLSLVVALSQTGLARLGYSYLWGFTFIWTTLLGCLFFVALQHVTHSRWSIVLRRVAEIFVGSIWLLLPLFIPVVLFVVWNDSFHLFPWADHERAASDHLIHGKLAYLNVEFFLLRAALFLTIWIGFATFYLRTSLRQDDGVGGAEATLKLRKVSAPFIPIFAFTITFAGIDWLLSLEPHWFSTMFGVYLFAGMVVASLSVITIATLWLNESGRLGDGLVRSDHIYSLGTLLFAFVCFWAYIAFSQYMLIWYGNIPEESFYIVERTSGAWLTISVLLVLVRFVIPFLLLLPRRAKTDPRLLVRLSFLLLAGQLLDLYWIIMPQLTKNVPAELLSTTPAPAWLNIAMIGPAVAMTGLLLFYVARFLSRHSAVAIGDPLLEESKRFRL